MPRKRIHTRTIVVEVYDEGDGTMSLEGRLDDVQAEDSGYFKTRLRNQDPRPPGVLHGLSASWRIDRMTAEILDTGGAFPHTPHDGCDAVLGWLSKLKGVPIAPGFNAKHQAALGGPRGCAHMNTLLQVMANSKSAASAYFMPSTRQEQIARFKAQLSETGRVGMTNTCHMWKEGGAIEVETRQEIRALDSHDD